MKKLSNTRWIGIISIGSAILYFISIVGMQKYLAADLNNVPAFLDNMVDNSASMLQYGWPGFIATLLLFPMVYFLSDTCKTNRFWTEVTKNMTIIGLVMVIIGYLFHLALTYFHAPIITQSGSADEELSLILIQSTIGLQDMFWLSGDLMAFLGFALLIGIRIHQEESRKAVHWMGVFAAVAAALGSFSFIPAFKGVALLSVLFIGGFTIFTVWEVLFGIQLFRQSKLQSHV